MEVVNVSTAISQVNADLALFKTSDIVSGVVHINDSGTTTIVFDGGYVFGEFHCLACAIENLNTLVCNYIIAHRNCGIEYSDYKRLHRN